MKKRVVVTVLLALALPLHAAWAAGRPPPTRSWSEVLVKKRFVVLESFGGAAVLDNETGLVWEQAPSTSTYTWAAAHTRCNTLSRGGRLGFRLPSYQELASLIDRAQTSPALPPGHPFSDVQLDLYWSATTSAGDATNAWVVAFVGNVNWGIYEKSTTRYAWCVRGGQGADAQ